MIRPKIGETWTVGSYENLVYMGVGFDFEKTKYLLFTDPVNGFFLIKKDEFWQSDLHKVKQ